MTSYTLESPTSANSRDYTCTFSVAAGNDGVKLIGDAAGTTNLHVASKEIQPSNIRSQFNLSQKQFFNLLMFTTPILQISKILSAFSFGF